VFFTANEKAEFALDCGCLSRADPDLLHLVDLDSIDNCPPEYLEKACHYPPPF
jgi:hypothetical protein